MDEIEEKATTPRSLPTSSPSNANVRDNSRQRKLSDQGKDLLRAGLNSTGSSSSSLSKKQPNAPGPSLPSTSSANTIFEQEDTLRKIREKDSNAAGGTRFTLAMPLHNNESKLHMERSVSSSSDEEDNQGQPVLGYIPSMETSMDIVTTERPMRALQVPLHNPVDQSQIVPQSDKTFTKEPFIHTHIWRDDAASETINQSAKPGGSSASPVDALRRSIALSRRSITSAAGAFSALALSETTTSTDNSSPSAPTAANTASPYRRRMSEKRLVTSSEVEKGSEKAMDLAKRGIGSDYTLFNRDWSVLLRGKRSSVRWSQLRHRYKHSDILFYVGALGDIPVATLKSGARASRLLFLERYSDGGIVYTMAKEKIGSHRVFWIAEGRKPTGLVDPNECRFVLVVRNGRAVVKCRDENTLLVPHLTSSRASLTSLASSFNSTVVDFIDKGDECVVRIASGMDVVLAFACLAIADRFQSYKSFVPNEKTRKEVLNERFETGIGDGDLDVFQQMSAQNLRHGTTTAANSLMY